MRFRQATGRAGNRPAKVDLRAPKYRPVIDRAIRNGAADDWARSAPVGFAIPLWRCVRYWSGESSFALYSAGMSTFFSCSKPPIYGYSERVPHTEMT